MPEFEAVPMSVDVADFGYEPMLHHTVDDIAERADRGDEFARRLMTVLGKFEYHDYLKSQEGNNALEN